MLVCITVRGASAHGYAPSNSGFATLRGIGRTTSLGTPFAEVDDMTYRRIVLPFLLLLFASAGCEIGADGTSDEISGSEQEPGDMESGDSPQPDQPVGDPDEPGDNPGDDPTPAVGCEAIGAQTSFTCTQVIGFSQTSNWYGGNNSLFESHASIDGSRWQLLWHGGAGVENWADSDYEGWDPQVPATQLVSSCGASSDSPDRVVLTISSNIYDVDSTVTEWADEISNAVAVIEAKAPDVQQIVLQPVVGGTEAQACDTRASANHPLIAQAVAEVADGVKVFAGPSPVVLSCDEFSDTKGHIAQDAREALALRIADCYAH